MLEENLYQRLQVKISRRLSPNQPMMRDYYTSDRFFLDPIPNRMILILGAMQQYCFHTKGVAGIHLHLVQPKNS